MELNIENLSPNLHIWVVYALYLNHVWLIADQRLTLQTKKSSLPFYDLNLAFLQCKKFSGKYNHHQLNSHELFLALALDRKLHN